MCHWQFVTGRACAMKFDRHTGRRRIRTESEGFFDHGHWQKRTTGCARAQRRRAHCSTESMPYPSYRQVVASAMARDEHLFLWDPIVYMVLDPEGDDVRDERCGPCRRRENRRSGR